MSKLPDDTTATATVTTNVIENESPQHFLVSSIRSSSSSSSNSTTDQENDLISSQKENLTKESKKEAMGDSCNSDGAVKTLTELTVSLTMDDDTPSVQHQPITLKTNANSIGAIKLQATRPPDDIRRRIGGIFYGGQSRRGYSNYWPRSTTYSSRGYWRPHSSGFYRGGGLRRFALSSSNDSSYHASSTARATGAAAVTRGTSQRTANAESPNNTVAYTYAFRPQSTRTFHNGAYRASRTWRGNVTSRSRSLTATSEFSSQFSSPDHATNSESAPHLSSVAAGSRTGESRRFGSSARYGQICSISPILYVAPTGTISILLDKGVVIEVAVDRAVRVICHDKFSAVCNGRGTGSCILHTKARVFQQDDKVFCNFGSSLASIEKAAVFGTQGVLFTMSHLNEAYLVSSTTVKGTMSVALGRLQFPSLDYDFTVRMFFTESQTGHQFTPLCNEIVHEARYGTRDDGALTLTINGIYIKQNGRGDVEVNCRPRHISCSPSDGTIHVRTNLVDMAVQEDDKAYVKRGLKRVHVSRSGMVVSDGNCITSMDHFGHIVSSA